MTGARCQPNEGFVQANHRESVHFSIREKLFSGRLGDLAGYFAEVHAGEPGDSPCHRFGQQGRYTTIRGTSAGSTFLIEKLPLKPG